MNPPIHGLSHTRSAFTATGRNVSRLGLALVVLLLTQGITQGVSVLWRAPNTIVHLGLPFASLEFENPLAGSERVLGHPVLEWLDADFSPGPPRGYDDWIVNPTNSIDGDVNEVWLRSTGHVAQAKFHVAATDIVSVHLLGDGNDGVAAVYVDGVLAARLDMNEANAPSQTALVIVRDLPVMLHQVLVRDESPGMNDDVALLGAAALKSDFKWLQPPAPAEVNNVFNGWNETSVTNRTPIVADDWVCTSANPVTTIRWWGSFANWVSNTPPPLVPNAFQITVWTDVPADPVDPDSFSHPGLAIWQTHCTDFRWQFVGWDYDPRTGRYEACFLFEQDLPEPQWFHQQPGPTGTNVYWISIAGEYWQGSSGIWPWGWKTRPRDPDSAAPDDAVRIYMPPAWTIRPGTEFVTGEPIYWPDRGQSWDLAFELISDFTSSGAKWEQRPDLSPQGMDVKNSQFPPPPVLLADDFLCTSPGPITNVTVWGSWLNDLAPANGSNVVFTLSIHADIPAQVSPTGYSMPGQMLHLWSFGPGTFRVSVEAAQLQEGWFMPPEMFLPGGDTICYRYDFGIPPLALFEQKGTPTKPVVYWLDCQAQVLPTPGTEDAQFGWKTCITNWNDTAVWVYGSEPFEQPIWNQLTWMGQRPLNLAFCINSGGQRVHELKWSQPPALFNPTNNFNGWNEPSRYNGTQIVADDWVCADRRPISDIHWWGSFIGWQLPSPPEAAHSVPSGFHFAIWSDVPAQANGSWSHPGTALWQFATTNYAMSFAGYDWDPRQPGAGPEACFKFHVDLRPEDWFYQEPGARTNIYWVSIAAVYPAGELPVFPWGWKTRPRDPTSPAPDDAVRVFVPTAPVPGSVFGQGSPLEFPAGNSWDMAFELTAGPEPQFTDFGDAPDSAAAPGYPTLLANNGARHLIGGPFLGARVDAETDGQPTANADGDDLNPPVGLNDEDGVVLPIALITVVPNNAVVTCSGPGLLQGWIDFNADKDWSDAGEQIITNWPVVAGANTVPFAVPAALATGQTYARFRLSKVAGLGPGGAAPDGEVEDYPITLQPLKWLQRPDLSTVGVDVFNDQWLADDFQCTQTGPITDIHLWGSFYRDHLPAGGLSNLTFTITLYSDVPDPDPSEPGNWSHPGQALCSMTFGPGQYQVGLCATVPGGEWWHAPPQSWVPQGDFNCYQFDFYIPAKDACRQVAGTIYWLAVKYNSQQAGAQFGWKTSPEHWNDDAVWLDTSQPLPVWRELRYGSGHPQTPGSMDLAFAVSGEPGQPDFDFGDAPDGAASPGYPTLLVNNGARHKIVPGLMLGNAIDAEADGQPNATATGDDNNPPAGPDDEDGVIFGAMAPGHAANITVTASAPGLLNAWVDFNGNGSWADAGEQIFTNAALVAGPNALSFSVSSNAPWGTALMARCRFNSTGNLGFAGLAADGEVEDYQVATVQLPTADLGDAPDSSNSAGPPTTMTAYPGVRANFPTVFALGSPPHGPVHWNPAAGFLGMGFSGEWEADLPPDQDFVSNLNPLANVADQDARDDGLMGPVILPHCAPGTISVFVTAPAPPLPLFLNAWFDWNRDGDWNDMVNCPDGTFAPEWAVQNMPVPPIPGGLIPFPVIKAWHPSLDKQPIWVRLTLSELQTPLPIGSFTGLAGGDGPPPGPLMPGGFQFGETEDYLLTDYDDQQKFDFGDAPSTYPVVLPNGARHLIVPNFHLGGQITDSETNGLPHALALGDDLNNIADEDGVTFPTPLLVNTNNCVDVFLVGLAGGRLDAWMDFDRSGAWDAAEQVLNAQPLVNGNNAGLCLAITNTAKLGTNFARFRLSSVGGLLPSGAVQDGEVEDYQVTLWQRRPTTNVVITWIGVTNATPTNQVVTVKWNAETNVHYEVLAAPSLGTNNGTDIVWSVISPEIIGPSNQHTHTNTSTSQRYYRVRAPWTYP
jgi:hypothetical protein